MACDIVLDAWALVELFTQKKKGLEVLHVIQKTVAKSGRLYLSLINWGEILYITEMRHGLQQKSFIKQKIAQMGIQIIDADAKRVELAASLKAQYRLPYADSFAAALALEKKADLITGDADFKKIEPKLKIIWV